MLWKPFSYVFAVSQNEAEIKSNKSQNRLTKAIAPTTLVSFSFAKKRAKFILSFARFYKDKDRKAASIYEQTLVII